MKYVRREAGARVASDSGIFIGRVARQPLNENEQYVVAEVAFDPGGQTKWHTHTFHQVLIITEGRGIVATKEEERHVTPGDVLYIPPGTLHWHGGEEDAAMAHLSLNGPGQTSWE